MNFRARTLLMLGTLALAGGAVAQSSGTVRKGGLPAPPPGGFSWCGIHHVPTKPQTHSIPKSGTFAETEPNNTRAQGNLTPFSMVGVPNAALTLTGSLPAGPAADEITVSPESNSTIPLASPTGIVAGTTRAVLATSAIGTSPDTGDFDFFSVALAQGQILRAEISGTTSLDSYLRVYDAAGTLIIENDDSPSGTDSLLQFTATSAGTYYVMVAAFGALPSSPFNANSGDGDGSQSSGQYTLQIETIAPINVNAAAESNSTIPLATDLGFVAGQERLTRTSSNISAAPRTGDFDFYRVRLLEGQEVAFAASASGASTLNPALLLYSSTGELLGFDDDSGEGDGSLLSYTAISNGDYFVAVTSSNAYPTSPFSDSTGTGDGSQTSGLYELLVESATAEVDVFTFDLQKGNVVSWSGGAGVASLELLRADTGELLMASSQELFLQASESPLPRGNRDVGAVIPEDGRYALRVRGEGTYSISVGGSRPGFQLKAPGTRQILFLDFNGATVNTTIWGGNQTAAVLSPLSSFLSDWGLTPQQESELITKIVADFRESIDESLRGGPNGDALVGPPGSFDLEIRNSRDHADPFGQPNVSRIIIGGTIREFGISTIGIASSIDLGNFNGEDEAVVLLDLLSAPASNPNSLNQFPLTGGRTRLDVVARGIANISAHEAGHFLGLFHTDQFNSVANIIDQGGNLANSVGVGADNIFGSADDVDVDFLSDFFNANEGFAGLQDTGAAVAFALSTGMDGITPTASPSPSPTSPPTISPSATATLTATASPTPTATPSPTEPPNDLAAALVQLTGLTEDLNSDEVFDAADVTQSLGN